MENQKSTPTNFVATVYGNLVPLNNSALSKARLKIFYKGMNRNGSYINEEIAEKLISTLPGTPVVGYYDSDKDDFLGHVSPESNRAYGFVPEEMNFKWEMFLDPDGVYRTYACTDIILWTGRYPIASKIVGKSHSMELNPDTVEGEWVEHDDEYYFEFTNAEFFGLCVLGEEYEPCFEGSSFYELHQQENNASISKDLKEMFSLYKSTIDSAEENPTGGQEMEDEKLKPQDLDNDSVEEEVKDQEEEVKEEENKPSETEEVKDESSEEGEEEETDEEEKEEEQEEPEQEEENKEEESEETDEPEEEEEEKEEVDFNSALAEKDKTIATLEAELKELREYKKAKVNEEKEEVLNTYSNKLTEEEIADFRNKIEDYNSAVELKKDIAVCLLDKQSNEEKIEESNYALINSRKNTFTGIEAIVAKYANKK